MVNGCSQSGGSQMHKEPDASAPVAMGVAHTHPANKCTNSVSHSHPNGGNTHKHKYDCSPGSSTYSPKPSVAHTHPAQKCTRSVSHPIAKKIRTSIVTVELNLECQERFHTDIQ